MSRYTGPRRRVIRRLDTELPGLTPHTLEDRDGLGGACAGVPDRQDIPVQVDEGMVVELYAR